DFLSSHPTNPKQAPPAARKTDGDATLRSGLAAGSTKTSPAPQISRHRPAREPPPPFSVLISPARGLCFPQANVIPKRWRKSPWASGSNALNWTFSAVSALPVLRHDAAPGGIAATTARLRESGEASRRTLCPNRRLVKLRTCAKPSALF